MLKGGEDKSSWCPSTATLSLPQSYCGDSANAGHAEPGGPGFGPLSWGAHGCYYCEKDLPDVSA